MPYPLEFYYVESKQEKKYTGSYTGRPDLNRLLQGDSNYWIGTGSTPYKIKKKLILADWSVFSWRYHKWSQVRETLARMMDDGFEIYLWYTHALTKLSKSDLPALIPLNEMIPTSYDEVRRDAARLGIALDETQILDDYWVDYVIHQREGFYPRYVSQQALNDSYLKHSLSNVLALLKKIEPPLVARFDEIYCEDDEPDENWEEEVWEAEISLNLGHLPRITDPHHVWLEGSKLSLKSSLTHFRFNLADLESISFYDVELHALAPVLHAASCARLLHLRKIKPFSPECAKSLRSIESLELSHLHTEILCKFLKYYNAHELKSLNVNYLLQDEDEESDDADECVSDDSHDTDDFTIGHCFPNLQELKLCVHDNFIDGSALVNQLLYAAPNVVRLQIHSTIFLHKIQLLPNSLPHLKLLSLNNSTINPNNLFRLLAAAPNLKTLHFTSGKCFDFDLTYYQNELEDDDMDFTLFNNLVLKHLTQTRLTKTDMPFETLQNLLMIAPHLVPLQLSHQILELMDDAPPKRSNSGVNLNADTANVTDLTVKKIFEPLGHPYCPAVNTYRLQVYHDIIINPMSCSVTDALRLNNSADLGLQPCVIPCSSTEIDASLYPGHLFYGQQKLYLNHHWQSLASLSPIEQMLRYHTSKPHPVEIQYSWRDNLYYIKSIQSGWVTIEFTLHVMDESFQLGSMAQGSFYSQFTIEPLELKQENPNGFDYLNAIYTQQRGSCTHRSFLFKYLNDQQKIPTRIIHNDCHSFVEVYLQDQSRWKSFDLGGAKVKLTIDSRPLMPSPPQNDDENYMADFGAIEQQDEASLALLCPESCTFDQALRVWEAKTYRHESMEDCGKDYLSDRKTRLIHGSSHQQLLGLRFGLSTYCQMHDQPLFYVQTPKDLKKTNIHIHQRTDDPHRFDDHVIISPLYEFMSTNEHGIVLVNLSRFTHEEWVRWNVWFDERPPHIKIIGLLYCDDRGVKPGHDFYSRFDFIESCQLTLEHYHEYIPQPARVLTQTEENTAEKTIDFFHTTDWEGILFGSWSLETTGWQYQEGLLSECANRHRIHIQNGPWDDDNFFHAWQEALFLQHLPENIVITRQEGYTWTTLTPYFQHHAIHPNDEYKILNPSTLDHFFKRYTIKEQTLQRLPGYLDEAIGQSILVYVTRTLNDHDWAKLLTHCELKNVHLQVALAPEVSLPTALASEQEPPLAQILTSSMCLHVIESTDVDTVIHQLLLTHGHETLVFDITSCQPSDLLMQLHAERVFVGESSSVQFSKQPGPLELALSQGRNVILRGQCSDEMVDAFASTFGMNTSAYRGHCFIVLQDASALTYLAHEKRLIDENEKRQLWCQLYECTACPAVIEPFLAHEPFAKLQARYRYFKHHPEESTNNAWLGVNHLSADRSSDLDEPIDAATFDKTRIDKVRLILAESPFVLITGLSGVGKSTFIVENFSNDAYALYYGQDSMRAWATDPGDDRCPILFWDEINFTRDLSQLENLMYGDERHLFIDGECYKISTRHKIIGAMNPNSFGAGRSCCEFIERHGNACLFTPLPLQVLEERIIKPLIEPLFSPSQQKLISLHVFALYQYLCDISEHALLISPRELHMIVLLTSLYPHHPNPEKLASYFGYHLLQHVIPEHHQREFNRAFAPLIQFEPINMPGDQAFLLTSSRQPFCQLLHSFLNLRGKRYTREIKDLGGIGGFLVEGEPGIGKTQLVKAALSFLGYQELTSLNDLAPASSHQSFFMMPALWSEEEKIACLLRLFDLGCIGIMDECNSGSMLETLINDLLMGKSPHGQLPLYFGFLLIAIQNPINMPGRRATSNALSRRLTKVILPPYNQNELDTILAHLGMQPHERHQLIQSYFKQRRYALLNQLTLPTCRNLLRVAQRHVSESIDINKILDLIMKDDDTPIVPPQVSHEPHSPRFFVASRPDEDEDEEHLRKRIKVEGQGVN